MGLGKWIAGGLGWAFFGPIGGIIGFLAGTAFDSTEKRNPNSQTTRGDFMASLVVLTAAVMKADGKVTKSELDFVKKYLLQAFGVAAAADGVKMLRDVLKQDIPVQKVSSQIGYHLDYSSRLQLLHYLFGIAMADGHAHIKEVELIEQIALQMNISHADFSSIKSMFYKDTNASYSILGVQPSATDDDVKKAYRKKAVEYHPDKVAYLGEDVQRSAKEKFQKITEAYEDIKKERGIV